MSLFVNGCVVLWCSPQPVEQYGCCRTDRKVIVCSCPCNWLQYVVCRIEACFRKPPSGSQEKQEWVIGIAQHLPECLTGQASRSFGSPGDDGPDGCCKAGLI